MKCVICGSVMQNSFVDWLYKCDNCSHLQSNLVPSSEATVDLELAASGLMPLRNNNFKIIVSKIQQLHFCKSNGGGSILDIGSNTGNFIESLKGTGLSVTGIEPIESLYRISVSKGHNVYHGYYPEVISGKNMCFDVITFNDVFEHIENLNYLMENILINLAKDGLLVISLPNSSGLIYRISSILYKVKYRNLFERLWQKNFPTVHYHYFSFDRLKMFVENYGFVEEARVQLKSISIKGFFSRLISDKNISVFNAIILLFGTLILTPFLYFFESDNICMIFKKK